MQRNEDQFKSIKSEYEKNLKQILEDYQLKIEGKEEKHKNEMKKMKDFYEVK